MSDGPSRNGEKTGGRFQPGNPGGPGRPAGSKHRATLLAEQLLDGQAGAIVERLIELALEGDTTALRLCVERLIPTVKARRIELADLPDVTGAADVVGAQAAVLAYVADGTLSAYEGAALGALIEGSRRAIETTDVVARLEKLEEAMSRSAGPYRR